MQYLGGKSRLSLSICQFLESIRSPNQVFLEPFCGGCNVTHKMSGERIAADAHPYLIVMYNALQGGWIPPESVSEEHYHYVKEHPDTDPALTAFVGFGCSFGAKWWGGYALNA